jgi:hypothetical protein
MIVKSAVCDTIPLPHNIRLSISVGGNDDCCRHRTLIILSFPSDRPRSPEEGLEENFAVGLRSELITNRICKYLLMRQHRIFELCRRTQQPSLTFCPLGGSTFGLWPLFHLSDGGKWTEMAATQHEETLRH